MNEEEKKAIENAENILKEWQKIVDIEDEIERDIEMNCYSEEMPFNTMKTLLNLIQKQEKVIDEMAEERLKTDINISKYVSDHTRVWDTENGIKKYFYRKVEEDEKKL